MKTILILMDTLNRHFLKAYYPDAEAITPNLDRLAERSVIFDNHYIGSAPCMPARRDILTGRLNFLERPWGAIEAFDVTLPELLRTKQIFSHIVTDHYHYTRIGGEGYLQQYHTWELIRGQESDPWISRIAEPNMPEQFLGRTMRQYQCNRAEFQTDADYPTPKTFASAIDWLKQNEGADNYFLQVEAFDPHEPFDAAEEFLKLYPDDFDTFYEWPRYAHCNEAETPEAVTHLRHRYCATLSMADKWLGKFLDEMDRQNLWEDTMVILTSDHGHMLGEHHCTGKNVFPAWNEMSHIPLFVHLPGGVRAGERIAALTQNIDIMPTLLDFYGIKEYPSDMRPLHGKSWMPLLEGHAEKIRDYAIYGWFGKPVNITDGRYTYFKAAKDQSNAPLSAYLSMPTTIMRYLGRGLPKGTVTMGHLKGVDMPVYQLDYALINQNMSAMMAKMGMADDPDLAKNMLFDTLSDPKQEHPLNHPDLEQQMQEALRLEMQAADAPIEQFERLGL